MGFIIFGLIVVIIGVVLWWQKSKKEKKLSVINSYEESTVKMIRENYEFIEGGYGEGNFSNFVEVNGYASSNDPLIAEFSGVECVYYHSMVTEEFEEEQSYRDQNNKTQYRWVKGSKVVEDFKRKINFELDDDTGLIGVNIDGAELNTENVYQEYERGENPDFSQRLNAGSSFLDSLVSTLSSGARGGSRGRRSNSGYRVLGYRYEEEAIPIDSKLYVIGEANDRGGDLNISAPKEEGKPFMVSLKTEDQIVQGINKKINAFKIGAFACFGIGLALALYGAFTSF